MRCRRLRSLFWGWWVSGDVFDRGTLWVGREGRAGYEDAVDWETVLGT